jgi:hypothetical protein
MPPAKSKIFDLLREQKNRSSLSYRDQYETRFERGRQPSRGEILEYARGVLQHHAERISHRKMDDPDYNRRSGEATLAIEAVRSLESAFMMANHLKKELAETTSQHHAAQALAAGLETSPTAVRVKWSADADAWCDQNVVEKWSMVQDREDAVYMFSDVKTAAMFKLHWR